MAYTIVSTQNKKNNEVALDIDSFLSILKKLDEVIVTFDIKKEYPEVVELQDELRWVIEILENPQDNEMNKVAKLIFKLAFFIQNTFSK